MGDYFNNITDSTIINRSTVENAYNKVRSDEGQDTAEVLVEIAKIVEESKNKEAGELFDSFNEEINKDEPKKSVLKNTWNGITKVLPILSTTANIAEKIIKIL